MQAKDINLLCRELLWERFQLDPLAEREQLQGLALRRKMIPLEETELTTLVKSLELIVHPFRKNRFSDQDRAWVQLYRMRNQLRRRAGTYLSPAATDAMGSGQFSIPLEVVLNHLRNLPDMPWHEPVQITGARLSGDFKSIILHAAWPQAEE